MIDTAHQVEDFNGDAGDTKARWRHDRRKTTLTRDKVVKRSARGKGVPHTAQLEPKTCSVALLSAIKQAWQPGEETQSSTRPRPLA